MADDWRLVVIEKVKSGGFWKTNTRFDSRDAARKDIDKVADKARSMGLKMRTKISEVADGYVGYLWIEGE